MTRAARKVDTKAVLADLARHLAVPVDALHGRVDCIPHHADFGGPALRFVYRDEMGRETGACFYDPGTGESRWRNGSRGGLFRMRGNSNRAGGGAVYLVDNEFQALALGARGYDAMVASLGFERMCSQSTTEERLIAVWTTGDPEDIARWS